MNGNFFLKTRNTQTREKNEEDDEGDALA